MVNKIETYNQYLDCLVKLYDILELDQDEVNKRTKEIKSLSWSLVDYEDSLYTN